MPWHNQTMYVKSNGELWGGGQQYQGILANGIANGTSVPTPRLIVNNIKRVFVGYTSAMAILNDNTLKCWGGTNGGQLGSGVVGGLSTTISDFPSPLKTFGELFLADFYTNAGVLIDENGTLYGAGTLSYGQLGWDISLAQLSVFINAQKDIINASLGNSHLLIVKKDGTVWGGGRNNVGQLALNGQNIEKMGIYKIFDEKAKLIHCSNDTSFVLREDGTLFGTGKNSYYAMGNNLVGDQFNFVQLLTGVKYVFSNGNFSSFVIKEDDSLWGCGRNYYGELGLGHKNQVQAWTKIMDGVKDVYGGLSHAAVVKKDGTLWTCGYNSNGQLLLGSTDTADHTTFVQIATDIDYLPGTVRKNIPADSIKVIPKQALRFEDATGQSYIKEDGSLAMYLDLDTVFETQDTAIAQAYLVNKTDSDTFYEITLTAVQAETDSLLISLNNNPFMGEVNLIIPGDLAPGQKIPLYVQVKTEQLRRNRTITSEIQARVKVR